MLSWRRGRRKDRAPASTAGQREADRALAKEDRKLRAVRGRTSEILEAAEELKALGSKNDFAARLRDALGGSGA